MPLWGCSMKFSCQAMYSYSVWHRKKGQSARLDVVDDQDFVLSLWAETKQKPLCQARKRRFRLTFSLEVARLWLRQQRNAELAHALAQQAPHDIVTTKKDYRLYILYFVTIIIIYAY